jgi:hypothetical protein
MADEILTRYRVDVSGLRADIDNVVGEFKRADNAGVESAQNVSAAYNEQNKSLTALQKTIARLTELRNNESDPAKVESYNKAIAQQSALYVKITQAIATKNEFEKNSLANAKAIADANAKQITSVERYQQSIAQLTAMLEKMNAAGGRDSLNVDPDKYDKIVQKIDDYNGLLALARDKEKQGIGLIDNMRARIESLTRARDASNDPAKITRYNSLIQKQGEIINGLMGESAIAEQSPAVEALSGGIKKLGTAIVAAFATDKIIEFGSECVMAFGEAEQGAIKLNAALGSNGGTGEQMNMLIEQAEQLSSQSVFSADAIKNVQTMAAQFGLLPNDIQTLLPVITDFASATGQDLQSAFTAVAGAINGNVRGLQVYGVALKEGQTTQQNYQNVIDQLTKKFGGQSKAMAETTLGSLQQLSNAWDDIKQAIGGAIAPTVAAIANFATGKLNAAKSTETLEQKINAERQSLNVLVIQLMAAGTGTRRRKELIEQIQTQYPNFLANLNAEKLTNQQLASRLAEVNKQYIAKAALAGVSAKVEEQQKKAGEAYSKYWDAKSKIQLIAEQKGWLNLIDTKKTAGEQGAQLIQLLKNEQTSLIASNNALSSEEKANNAGKLNTQIARISTTMQDVYGAMNDANVAGGEYNESVKTLTTEQKKYNDMQAEFGNVLKENGDETVDYSKKTKAELEKILEVQPNNKFANDALQAIKDAEDKARDEKAQAEQRAQDKADAASEQAQQRREQALAALQQMEQQFNDNRLNALARTELDALEIQRAAEIKKAQMLFAATGGKIDATGNAVGNPDAVQAYNNTVESINAATDEKIKQNKIKSAQETEQFIRELNDDAVANELTVALDNADIQSTAQINALKQGYVQKGVFTAGAEQELQNKILAIEFDTQQKKIEIQKQFAAEQLKIATDRVDSDTLKIKQDEIDAFNQRGDNSASATQRLNDRLAEIDKKANEKKQKLSQDANQKIAGYERDLTKAKQDEQTKQTENAVQNAETEKQDTLKIRQEIFEKSKELANELFDLNAAFSQAKIANLEGEKDENQKRYDDDLAALQTQLDNRLITEQQFNLRKKDLDNKKAADEKEIQKKINEVKKKQDVANRVRALFEIGLNTAVAITRLGRDPGYPAATPLVVLVSALAAIQAAAVLAQPLPKYKRGTNYLRRMNGEPIGDDTIPIYADEGERIVPRNQNIRHWKIYESLDNNSFDKLIREKYVAPALMQQQRDFEMTRENNFTNNIAKSIVLNSNNGVTDATHFSTAFYEFSRMWKKGIRISNIDEIQFENNTIKSIYNR